ncbi:lipoprotein [Desulfonatronum thiodismutans]|uniref:lipoprotein n=1 Tax=Desulfonatronum thiodismutans TaxID=159290 RepID=UPI0004ABE2FD|nr:lipoprotein [Desulfonatronum thiodismutans]
MKKSLIFLCFLILLTGCSHLSVKHLPRNQLLPNQTDVISLDFWNFQYMARMEGDRYSVTGKALPNTTVWPGWAEWFQDLDFFAYISDEQGVVFARDHNSYLVRRMDPKGVDFSFAIPLKAVPSDKDVFLTFGYRMRLTQGEFQAVPRREESLSGEVDVFSAQQGPVPR